MTTPLLKLRCQTAEDVDVVASLLQDAVVRACDVQFLKSEGRFVALFNRFRWEVQNKDMGTPTKDAAYEDVAEGAELDMVNGKNQRVHTGLCLEHVTNVRSKNFPKDAPEDFLNLLSVISGDTSTTLLFADNVSVQIQHKSLALFIEDLGESWPTAWRPNHEARSEAGPEST